MRLNTIHTLSLCTPRIAPYRCAVSITAATPCGFGAVLAVSPIYAVGFLDLQLLAA